MEYKAYKCKSFNVYTIKTNRFKTAHMEIIFRKKVDKNDLSSYSLLMDVLTESTKKYPKRKDLSTRFEELYRLSVYGNTVRVGNTLNSIILADFINPTYIDDQSYLENVIKEIIDVIINPNVTNDEFDIKVFNNNKERLKNSIEALKENPAKQSIYGALNLLIGDTISKYRILGTIEDLDKITPASLYDTYKRLLKENTCDIFVIGDFDTDNLVEIIKKYFKHRYINNLDLQLSLTNESRKKVKILEKDSNNIQTNVAMIYNLNDLTDNERNIVFHVFNFIFGNGGLTSHLYKKIREENSLCYAIYSYFVKYDDLVIIQTSLDYNNVKKTIDYVKKCLKEMQNGLFTEEELNDAKNNIIMSLEFSLDNNNAIVNNQVFKIYDNLPDIEQRKEMVKNITKDDIIKVSKKLKLNNIFILKGGSK